MSCSALSVNPKHRNHTFLSSLQSQQSLPPASESWQLEVIAAGEPVGGRHGGEPVRGRRGGEPVETGMEVSLWGGRHGGEPVGGRRSGEPR